MRRMLWWSFPRPTVSLTAGLALSTALVLGCGRSSSSPNNPSAPSQNVSGAWVGTWLSARGTGGSVTSQLTQTGSLLTGSASVTGSPCNSSGSVSGTISGTSITIGVAFPGSQQANFSGVVNSTATSMSGQYSVAGGLCSGDAGTWNMSRGGTSTPGTSALTPLACSQETSIRSIESVTAASVEFVNNRSEAVRVHWLDYQSRRQFWFTMNPGQVLTQGTYLTHAWLVANPADRCLAIYLPIQGTGRAIIQ